MKKSFSSERWTLIVFIMFGMMAIYFLIQGTSTNKNRENYHENTNTNHENRRYSPNQSIIEAFEMKDPLFSTTRHYGDPNIIQAPCEGKVTIPSSNPNPSLVQPTQTRQMIYPTSNDCGTSRRTLQDVSLNQKLVGKQNPKTYNTPIIPNRLYDEGTSWTNDSFIIPTDINNQKTQEFSQNGYTTTYADMMCPSSTLTTREGYQSATPNYNPTTSVLRKSWNERPIEKTFLQSSKYQKGQCHNVIDYQPSSNDVYCTQNPAQDVAPVQLVEKTMLNAPWGYYPENVKTNTPINLPPQQIGLCNSPSYNQQLNTTLLQPNLIAYSNINVTDANQSNLGISYTQPHLPTKLVEIPGTDAQAFVEIDPVSYSATQLQDSSFPNTSSNENSPYHAYPHVTVGTQNPRFIYDPRFTGYGTSSRQYIEPMTGQSRFNYDDIDAHRQYNYLTKSNIDFLPNMASSGAYQPQVMTNMDIRQLAEQAFHNDTLQQRTELQNRLMQKSIHRSRQRKEAPIRVHN